MASGYTKSEAVAEVAKLLPRIRSENLSYRTVALTLQQRYGLDKPPSPATVGRYIQEAEQAAPPPYADNAARLLHPDNYPQFRSLFPAPGGGQYATSTTHHALHHIIYALAQKTDLPAWVIDYWHLPADINTNISKKLDLLTFILLMAPRHGKTMCVLHSIIALICVNPDIRILYCQGVKETSEKAMALVMAELEHNTQLKEHYGPFRDDHKKWSYKNGFIVHRRQVNAITDTFTPVGINVNIRSLDADLLIIDDPQDLDRAESETTTNRDYRKITAEFMTRREAHTPVLMVGSHIPTLHGDVFAQIEDNLKNLQTEHQIILVRKRPAHRETECEGPPHVSCVEWPQKRDWKFLQAQKALLGEDMYEAVYQQQPRPPGTRPFPSETVGTLRPQGVLDPDRSWTDTHDHCPTCQGDLYTTLGFDPAASDNPRASYSALAVAQGCIKCETIYLTDFWHKRQSPELHAPLICSYAAAYNVHYVKIETNAYQKALARDPVLRDGARRHQFHIDEHQTDDRKNTPRFGIPNLARYMTDNKMSIPAKTETDIEYYKPLRDALIRYPAKPDDLPMALWLTASMIWECWTLYANPDPIRLPHLEANVPQYMLDNPWKVNLAEIPNE